jgi:hypothetical protein
MITGSNMRRLFVLLALLAIPAVSYADDASRAFLWEQANARMASARTQDDFRDAARIYNRLVADGARNGPLFYNLGTALLLAGDGENAAAALRRAERHLGSTPDIRINLRRALALQAGQPDADLPWDRVVFFWHYDEPLRVRVLAALGGWCLLWLALLLRLFARAPAEPGTSAATAGTGRVRAFANSCLFFGALLLVVCSCSAGVSLLQEHDDDRTWSERVPVSRPVTGHTP